MKKVLFATTALVASAGIASAQGVAISGSAEMGVIGGTGVELQFSQNVDVTFAMTGTTDNGLRFGANVDLDEAAGIAGPETDDGGTTVFISGNFGNLTMGDTDGAFDWALQEVNLVGGSINDAETAHAGFNGNSVMDGFDGKDGQIVRYDYTFGDFGFGVSAELDDAAGGDDPTFQVGLRYSGDVGGMTLGFGLGYGTTQLVGGAQSSEVGVSANATFGGGFQVGVNYTQFDNVTLGTAGTATFRGAVDSHMAVGAGYSSGAIGIGVNYGVYEGTGANPNSEGFGLAANYDLGGGASVRFGYGSSKFRGGATTDSYSLGVAMSF